MFLFSNNKYIWFINRLAKMSMREILWRVYEKAKKAVDKQRRFSCIKIDVPPDTCLYMLSEHVVADKLNTYFPETVNHHFKTALNALDNRLESFNSEVCFEDGIDWHLDPTSGNCWPKKFWGAINTRDKCYGGVKFVWEFNRLYYLVSLGLCYRMTQEKQYADQVGRLIVSWVLQNQYPIGVNWTSGIEAGIRLSNLVWAMSFLEGHKFSKEILLAINQFVWSHAQHLRRYPSKYSSSNNHMLAEAFGLFVAGLYFPHLPGAKKWLAEGSRILDREAERQILQDGGSFEFSTTYLSFVVDFFLLYRHICSLHKRPFNPAVEECLKKASAFISSILDAEGGAPNIGDQDSAVLVNFGLDNAQNFSSILNTSAVLFSQKKGPFIGPDIKTFLLTGYGGPEKENCRTVSHHFFRHSGLAVIRDQLNHKEVLFVGNATAMGMAPLYAHGHLDALSFSLSVDGRPVFVDPGTYLYQNGGKWREYFRSTAAHNTLRLNSTDFSTQPGDFMYGRPYKITHNRLTREDKLLVWTASHDAYSQAPLKGSVARRVMWDLPKIVITDHVLAAVPVFAELFFHCHPDCRVKKKWNGLMIRCRDIEIELNYEPSLSCEIFNGAHDPLLGWYSPAFNELSACDTIRLSGDFGKECRLTCVIQIH